MKLVYVVAPDYDAYLRYTGRQDPNGDDALVQYVYVKPNWRIQTPKSGTAEFMFLKHWQSRPDWRYLYNRALSLRGRRT